MISISPYVSSLTDDVFALAGLPAEVIAVLFAYYSRSSKGLRENLAELLADQELAIAPAEVGAAPTFAFATQKARAFHEKWVVGYGHASVAEHAVVHLALEHISILASKVVEDARLGSYTEKSTRYVNFAQGTRSRVVAPLEVLDHGPTLDLFIETTDMLFEAYQDVTARLTEAIGEAHPVSAFPSVAAWEIARRTKAFDLARGLLPASTATNVGLTMNARELGHLLRKMAGHPLGEVRQLGQRMQAAGLTVAPTLLRGEAEELTLDERDAAEHDLNGGLLAPVAQTIRTSPGPVRVLHHDELGCLHIAVALGYDGIRDPYRDHAHATATVRRALEERSARAPLSRAFEAASLQVELDLDYGAYRDLQRHRMLFPQTGPLTCRIGFDVSDDLRRYGVADRYEQAMEKAAWAWERLADLDIWAAQGVVPLGYNHRVLWSLNLRELAHVVELRSGRQGHPRYRRIAIALADAAEVIYPWLRGMLRVDRNDYPLPRA